MEVQAFSGGWDYTELPDNIMVGANCYLENRESFRRFRSHRRPGLVLGEGVYVYNWTAFSLEPTAVVEIGAGSTLVGASFWCAERIRVGERVILSYNVIIADSDFHPRDPILRRQDAIAISPTGDPSRRPPLATHPVIIGDDVWVGPGAIILKGTHIGDRARIGAGAVVTGDVPPGTMVAGNPARIVAERAMQS